MTMSSRKYLFSTVSGLLALMVCGVSARAQGDDAAGMSPAVVKSEFIFERAPFQAAHASTIVETRDGLLAAWFGGTRERALDVSIWMARHDGQKWSEPVEVANGADEENRIQYPCWNPVLFQPRRGPLLLFYKVGPSPESWWGMLKKSDDNGHTWSAAKRLPDKIYGPVRNKPVELADNLILCGSSTENAGWRIHMERTRSFGQQWSRTDALNRAIDYGVIQPTILVHDGGRIQILCRTKQHVIVESWSDDGGFTWSRVVPTDLPNPNSAIDSVMLRDSRSLLVYNHSATDRGLLNVSTSPDGRKWFAGIVLENEPGSEFSYPAVIQTSDGMVHVTYTWKRQKIKHVVIDPFKLPQREIVSGQWP
jgi:predicted neuraminidase